MARRSGTQTSSSSRKVIQPPVAAASPALRADETPPFSLAITRMRPSNAARRAAVSSVEPSSITMISSAGRVWASTLSIASPTSAARL